MSVEERVVCPRAELTFDKVVSVPLPPVGRRPREALVLLGHDGEPRAFLNLCRHLPVPIDGGSKQYLTYDGNYLICGTHGALFRRDDGMCIAGPCLNLPLERLPLREEGGVLILTL